MWFQPSRPRLAPPPPLHMKWMSPNGRPVRGLKPIVAGAHQRAQHASTLSGVACASASQTASMIACADAIVQPVQAAGSTGFTTEPAGASTCRARNAPSLKRTSDPSDMNNARNADDAVFGSVLLT